MGFGGYDVSKAARDGDSVVATMRQYLQNANRKQNAMQLVAPPLARDPKWERNLFGPNYPLVAEPLDDPTGNSRRDGQPEPRLYEYPVAWNVTIGREQHVPWEMLRRSSELPIFRACIELRKTELSSMEWGIRVNPKVASRQSLKSGQNADMVASELRQKHRDEIDRLESWWQYPDRKNGRNFSEWISLCADEQLTHDALAIYPHSTYGGDLLGLWVLDGTTVMPLLDETGGRPLPPLAAFQQILYGFPRGEFTAFTYEDDQGRAVTPNGYKQGQLVYKRRTPRTTTPYGYSATEQALLSGLLYNNRFNWMTKNFTEGVLPQAFMESDGTLDWTPDQLMDYERDFNMRMAGMTSERMRMQFLPPGLKPAVLKNPADQFGVDFDMYLIKLVAMHFGVTATELGFPESGGLGSSGFHEGQEDINFRRGRLPDLRWFADMCTELSINYLNMNPDLEFYFLGLDSEDEAEADGLDQQRVASGRMTINEARASIGLNGFDFKEANMPMLQTERGVVFLDGSSELAPMGTMIEPLSQNNIVPGVGQGTGAGTSPGAAAPSRQQGTAPSPQAAARNNASKDAELAAYKKFLKSGKTREFNFEFLTKAEAEDLIRPKVPIRNWSLYTDGI